MLTTDDVYDAVWHHGLLNAGFFSAWLPAVGVLSQKPDSFWRSWRIDLVRDLLGIPAIHARMQNLNGEAIVTVLKHRHPRPLSRASVRRTLARGGGRASDP